MTTDLREGRKYAPTDGSESLTMRPIYRHNFRLIWDQHGKRYECSRCGANAATDSSVCVPNDGVTGTNPHRVSVP